MAHLALVGQGPEIGIDFVLAQRGDRQRRHEMMCRGGHDAAHRRTPLAQSTDQLEALIGGDPAGNDEYYAPVLKQIDSPLPSAGASMLPPEEEGEGDRYHLHCDEPY